MKYDMKSSDLFFVGLMLIAAFNAIVLISAITTKDAKVETLEAEVEDLTNEVEFWKHNACFHSKAPPKKCDK